MVLGLALWLFIRIELDAFQALGVVLGFLLLIALFAGATKQFATALLVIVGVWVLTGVHTYFDAGAEALAVTHLMPFFLIPLSILMWNAFLLAMSVPYVLPIAFLVVFLPLLTEDLWEIGG
jgi:hypothetical protein